MRRSWRTLLPLALLAVVVGWWYAQNRPHPIAPPQTSTSVAGASIPAPAALPPFLPPEARSTLALIAQGGPFPNRQDGEVFGNFEHLLPAEPRGYYHEYTVATPGAHDRGARRIITGGTPPAAYWYTRDHYRSFREFQVPR